MSAAGRPRRSPALARHAAALLLAFSAVAGRAEVTREDAMPLSAFPRERLVVETRSARRIEFDAWRADTPQAREQGLMFVPHIDASQAMFFVYDPPARVAMWMKNTLIPLDMLFVDSFGCVLMVRRDARPESLELIRSPDTVALVVELAGGTAARSGIATGASVSLPGAGWPARRRACPLVP